MAACLLATQQRTQTSRKMRIYFPFLSFLKHLVFFLCLSTKYPASQSIMASYKIESIPGKGKGLVALTDIARGTRILVEKSLFKVMAPIHSLDSAILARVVALSKDQLRQFLSLHNAHANLKPFTGIFKTNALPCGSDSPVGSVYPTICLINHTCIPNAHNNWNDNLQHETIHAICDIKAGEEITISYTAGESSKQRAAKVKCDGVTRG
jgi:hypothetical protein